MNMISGCKDFATSADIMGITPYELPNISDNTLLSEEEKLIKVESHILGKEVNLIDVKEM